MTMATDGPVISGLAYTVTEIDGRPPTGLAGCLGDRTLTLVGNGLSPSGPRHRERPPRGHPVSSEGPRPGR